MSKHYFQRLYETTQTRFWVNNPTREEAKLAIEHGAVSCTSNPSFSSNIISRDPDYAMKIVKECVRECRDDGAAADLVQQRLIRDIAEIFLPVFEASGGKQGFVSIQGNPALDDDTNHIIEEEREYRKIAPNIIAKIPATAAGLQAIEKLVEEDMPVIATENYGLPQAVKACEAYQRASVKSGKWPALFVTHITGIYDECIAKKVAKEQIDIDPAVLKAGGLYLARKEFRLMKARNYPGVMLGGGARNNDHFTGLVGGDAHITINWSTAVDLLELDLPISKSIDEPFDQSIIDELLAKIPDFACSWREDGMAIDDFAEYEPLLFFRNMFMNGWGKLLDTVRASR